MKFGLQIGQLTVVMKFRFHTFTRSVIFNPNFSRYHPRLLNVCGTCVIITS